eukprot:6186481-Pleurochrysis_carterae.AAC.3
MSGIEVVKRVQAASHSSCICCWRAHRSERGDEDADNLLAVQRASTVVSRRQHGPPRSPVCVCARWRLGLTTAALRRDHEPPSPMLCARRQEAGVRAPSSVCSPGRQSSKRGFQNGETSVTKVRLAVLSDQPAVAAAPPWCERHRAGGPRARRHCVRSARPGNILLRASHAIDPVESAPITSHAA